MTLISWRSHFTAVAALLVVTAVTGLSAAPAAGQDEGPSTAEAQQPPIQAKPGTPEGTPRTDQTVDVTKGTRLMLTNAAGEVVVTAWDRDAVRVQANHSSREQIEVQTAESALRVRSRVARGRSGLVDYRITVPPWMPINLSGTYLEADVSGTAAEITVETVGGSVRVNGGSGAVSVRSVEGRITVEKTTGRVQANTVNEGIRLSNTQGEVIADTVNGDVIIDNAQTSSLEVSTVNGDVTFNGTVRENGVYKLSTHGGDIRVGLGGAANAIVFVRTFRGDFSADFPIQLPEGQSASRGSKRFNFTLGAGRARIEVQSFNGDIHLARATVTSPDEERLKRRRSKPQNKLFDVDFDVHIDTEAIERMAARLAEKAAEMDFDRMHEDFDHMSEDIERMLEHLPVIPPMPPLPPMPPMPELAPRAPLPPAPPMPPMPPMPPSPEYGEPRL